LEADRSGDRFKAFHERTPMMSLTVVRGWRQAYLNEVGLIGSIFRDTVMPDGSTHSWLVRQSK